MKRYLKTSDAYTVNRGAMKLGMQLTAGMWNALKHRIV